MASYGVMSKQTNFAPAAMPQTGKRSQTPAMAPVVAPGQGQGLQGGPPPQKVEEQPPPDPNNPTAAPGTIHAYIRPRHYKPGDPNAAAPPPADAAWFIANVDNRISEDQWNAWISMGLLDPSATGNARFKNENVDENGQPIPGLFEKPTDCPEGKAKFGENQCLPLGDPRVGGGGGGGGDQGGGGPGGNAYGMSDEERKYLSAITDLARTMESQGKQLFQVGLPAYQQATDYFQKILGLKGRAGVQEAIAPAAEQVAGAYRGARAQIVMSGARGAAKDIALADAARAQAGDINTIASGQQVNAAQGLLASSQFGVTAGFQGEGQAAATEQAVSSALTQNRQFGESLTQNWNIAALNARTTKEVAALQAQVSREQIAMQREIAQANLAQQASQFQQQMALMLDQFEEQMRQFNISQETARHGSNMGAIGAGVGAIATIAVIV